MISIIKEEIEMSDYLKKKVIWACNFNNTTPIIKNGSLLKLEPTNIAYMMGISNTRTHIKTNEEINIKLVSSRLKEIRKSLNMTMRDLAEKFNTSSSAISNYENSKY